MIVVKLFLVMPRVCLQVVIVVFTDLLTIFEIILMEKRKGELFAFICLSSLCTCVRVTF